MVLSFCSRAKPHAAIPASRELLTMSSCHVQRHFPGALGTGLSAPRHQPRRHWPSGDQAASRDNDRPRFPRPVPMPRGPPLPQIRHATSSPPLILQFSQTRPVYLLGDFNATLGEDCTDVAGGHHPREADPCWRRLACHPWCYLLLILCHLFLRRREADPHLHPFQRSHRTSGLHPDFLDVGLS